MNYYEILKILAAAIGVCFAVWRMRLYLGPVLSLSVISEKLDDDMASYSLILMNTGKVPAKDVQIEFDSSEVIEAIRYSPYKEVILEITEKLRAEVIPTVPNGHSVEFFLGTGKHKADEESWDTSTISVKIYCNGYFDDSTSWRRKSKGSISFGNWKLNTERNKIKLCNEN